MRGINAMKDAETTYKSHTPIFDNPLKAIRYNDRRAYKYEEEAKKILERMKR